LRRRGWSCRRRVRGVRRWSWWSQWLRRARRSVVGRRRRQGRYLAGRRRNVRSRRRRGGGRLRLGQEGRDRHFAPARAQCKFSLRGGRPVGGKQRRCHLAQGGLRAVRCRAHGAACHRTHGHDEAWRNVRGCGGSRRIDAEGGADRHPARTDVSSKVALGRSSADGAGRVTREPHLPVAGDPDRCRSEPTHRDARLVECAHSGEQSSAQRCGGGWRQGPARQDGAQGHALVGFGCDPKPVRIGAPRKDWREGWMTVLEEPLNSRNRTCCLHRGNGDLVHYHGFSALEDGLPALACSRIDEFDQPRLGLALRHMGAIVTSQDMAYVNVQPCVGGDVWTLPPFGQGLTSSPGV
jgi:hypothetical protein